MKLSVESKKTTKNNLIWNYQQKVVSQSQTVAFNQNIDFFKCFIDTEQEYMIYEWSLNKWNIALRLHSILSVLILVITQLLYFWKAPI